MYEEKESRQIKLSGQSDKRLYRRFPEYEATRSILLSLDEMIVHHRVTPWLQIRQDGEKYFLPKNTTQTRWPLEWSLGVTPPPPPPHLGLGVRPMCFPYVKKCSSKNSRGMHSFCLYVRITSNPDGWNQTPSRL